MSEGQRRHWFQFTLRDIIMAMFWWGTFCGGMVLFRGLWRHELVSLETETPAYVVVGGLLFISLPAAAGSLFGHWWLGVLLGLAAFTLYAAYCLIAIAINGI